MLAKFEGFSRFVHGSFTRARQNRGISNLREPDMIVPLETPQSPTPARELMDHRVVRIRFESRASLLDAFALAQRESWIEDCHVILPRLELVIRMAGGLSIDRGPRAVRHRAGQGTPSFAS